MTYKEDVAFIAKSFVGQPATPQTLECIKSELWCAYSKRKSVGEDVPRLEPKLDLDTNAVYLAEVDDDTH